MSGAGHGAASADVARFRSLVTELLGLHCSSWSSAQLGEVLSERLRATRCVGLDAYEGLVRAPRGEEREAFALAARLTVGETYFFRESEQLTAAVLAALPERAQARRREGAGPVRILSAGCASGEEPYTLAMLIREQGGSPALASIVGIDASAAAIERARRGRYSAWALRATSPALRERYFTPAGRHFDLCDEIRAAVRFQGHNLLDEDASFFRPDAFDLIFCRNVTIYLTPEATQVVITRLAGALAPGGFLFLGHTETLRGLSEEFSLIQSHGSFYYQKSRPPPIPPGAEPVCPKARSTPIPLAAPALPTIGSWLEDIQHASDRVAVIAGETRSPRSRLPAREAAARRGVGPGARVTRARAFELFRAERFDDALALLKDGDGDATSDDPEIHLLLAVILTLRGEIERAEIGCRRVLALRGFAPGAHYLLALCREHAGDRAAAANHFGIAARLDPTFSMPHLHLGVFARQAGDLVTSSAEIHLALDLLPRDDPDRIVMFGGGFSCSALVRLCRAELDVRGGGNK